MKNLKKIMLLLITVSLVTFTSCNNDEEDDNGGGNGADEFITIKIDGVDWSSSTSFDLTSASKGENTLSVQASTDNGEAVRFTIANYTGIGTYTTGDNITNTNSCSYITITPVATWTSTFDIGTGTINIASDDDVTVEGTFSFDGFNAADGTTKVFTNGSFKANID